MFESGRPITADDLQTIEADDILTSRVIPQDGALTPAPLIAPSILSADFARLGEEVRDVMDAGRDWVHLDVMDGHFVPNIAFGAAVVAALRPHGGKLFDCHLMIEPSDPHFEALARAGCDSITVQAEACTHLDHLLQAIRGLCREAGVSLNPATPESAIEYVPDRLDLVPLMSVNPGFGGQAFMREGLDWFWDETLYAELLKVTGGRERIRAFMETLAPERLGEAPTLIPRLHAQNTRLYTHSVREGGAPLRPDMAASIAAARAEGLALAIANTTSSENVAALLAPALGASWRALFATVAAGDMVAARKPAPDVYRLALGGLGLAPKRDAGAGGQPQRRPRGAGRERACRRAAQLLCARRRSRRRARHLSAQRDDDAVRAAGDPRGGLAGVSVVGPALARGAAGD